MSLKSNKTCGAQMQAQGIASFSRPAPLYAANYGNGDIYIEGQSTTSRANGELPKLIRLVKYAKFIPGERHTTVSERSRQQCSASTGKLRALPQQSQWQQSHTKPRPTEAGFSRVTRHTADRQQSSSKGTQPTVCEPMGNNECSAQPTKQNTKHTTLLWRLQAVARWHPTPTAYTGPQDQHVGLKEVRPRHVHRARLFKSMVACSPRPRLWLTTCLAGIV